MLTIYAWKSFLNSHKKPLIILHGNKQLNVSMKSKSKKAFSVHNEPIPEQGKAIYLLGAPFYNTYTYQSISPEKKEIAGLDYFHLEASISEKQHRQVTVFPEAESARIFHNHLTSKGVTFLKSLHPTIKVEPLIPWLYQHFYQGTPSHTQHKILIELENEILFMNRLSNDLLHLTTNKTENSHHLRSRFRFFSNQNTGIQETNLESFIETIVAIPSIRSPSKKRVWKGRLSQPVKKWFSPNRTVLSYAFSAFTLAVTIYTLSHLFLIKQDYTTLKTELQDIKHTENQARKIHQIELEYFQKKALRKATTRSKIKFSQKLEFLDQKLPDKSWLKGVIFLNQEVTLTIISTNKLTTAILNDFSKKLGHSNFQVLNQSSSKLKGMNLHTLTLKFSS